MISIYFTYSVTVTAILFSYLTYLESISLFVASNRSVSDVFSPSSGKPQGSFLGPILFVIFVTQRNVGYSSLQLILNFKVPH